jgi:hypothetical protein
LNLIPASDRVAPHTARRSARVILQICATGRANRTFMARFIGLSPQGSFRYFSIYYKLAKQFSCTCFISIDFAISFLLFVPTGSPALRALPHHSSRANRLTLSAKCLSPGRLRFAAQAASDSDRVRPAASAVPCGRWPLPCRDHLHTPTYHTLDYHRAPSWPRPL